MTTLIEQIANELAHLRETGLYRKLLEVEERNGVRALVGGREVVLFSSNDYLGLSRHPEVVAASIEATRFWGAGAGASRLVSGNTKLYRELERELRDFAGTESAAVFASGYAANIGSIPALAGPEDVILADELNHASLIDGCRLSLAEKKIYAHRDMEALERLLKESGRFRRRFIVSEGIYSVNGDIAPLREIVHLARSYAACVMLDDAHAIGVLGEGGGGTVEHLGIEPCSIDVRMGTLSKAVGCAGGFISGSIPMVDLIVNRARSLIYSTAMPAGTVAAAAVAVRLMRGARDLRTRLRSVSSRVRQALGNMGFNTGRSESHIVPVIVGDERKALELSSKLLEHGIFVPALRPPTVPPNSSCLRVSLSAKHTDREIDALLSACNDSA